MAVSGMSVFHVIYHAISFISCSFTSEAQQKQVHTSHRL